MHWITIVKDALAITLLLCFMVLPRLLADADDAYETEEVEDAAEVPRRLGVNGVGETKEKDITEDPLSE